MVSLLLQFSRSINVVHLPFTTEFAEYTSAQERIALGKKSRKLEASKRRNEMQELIDDAAYVHCFL
jgi:hypothetical protein